MSHHFDFFLHIKNQSTGFHKQLGRFITSCSQIGGKKLINKWKFLHIAPLSLIFMIKTLDLSFIELYILQVNILISD